jgi:hypothetical protein
MDAIFQGLDAWLVAVVFAAAMLGSWVLGWRRGDRLAAESGEDPGTKFTDASMALLGLLLAFTFAMALGRHDRRRDCVIVESNALGDFYTTAALLPDKHRAPLQAVIREYARHLLETPYERLPDAAQDEAVRRDQQLFSRMTELVAKAVADNTPVAIVLAQTLNNVSSTNAARLAAFEEYLPWSIVALLLLASLVPSFLIGEKQGLSKKRHLSGSVSFIVLVTLVIFVTLDLNQPRRGLIRVNQEPLERLVQSIEK